MRGMTPTRLASLLSMLILATACAGPWHRDTARAVEAPPPALSRLADPPRAPTADVATTPTAPTPSVAVALSAPAGADRRVWLDGVAAGLRATGRDAVLTVANNDCSGPVESTWSVQDVPTADVPCPCRDAAEGRSCYLVRWVDAAPAVAAR